MSARGITQAEQSRLLMRGNPFIIVSAERPMFTGAENDARTMALYDLLTREYFYAPDRITFGRGLWEGRRERVLVLSLEGYGAPIQRALRLSGAIAARFDQDAIVYVNASRESFLVNAQDAVDVLQYIGAWRSLGDTEPANVDAWTHVYNTFYCAERVS
jgi:hypothetical protein